MRIARLGFVLMLIACASLLALGAPPSKQAAGAAPVPDQIISAKKVFIANASVGCNPIGTTPFGGQDRPYNQFFAAMKNWGRYQLVPSPADADLAFEISFTCPTISPSVVKGNSFGYPYDPQLSLVIRDVKTHIVLWKITEHVELAVLQGHRNENFDRAMAALVLDLKNLTRRSQAGSK